MKFGPRKPSLKKSISARTTGKIKRKIKKTVIPGYGKKGMGYIKDPEKAVYNKIYNKTTVGIDDIISSNQNNTDNAPNSTSNTVNNEYSNKQSIAKPNDAHTTPVQTPQSVHTQQTPPQNTGKPITDKQLIGFCAVCGILFLTLIVYLFTADETEDKQTDTPQQTQAAVVVTPPPAEKLIEPSQHGTTEYAEYIFYKAVNDSLNVTDEQLQEAVAFIKANTNSYFTTQENMEKTMYYGKLIAYKYRNSGNDYEKAGNQAYRTVEYVYRGIDKTTDETTLKNLKKLQDMADELPDLK